MKRRAFLAGAALVAGGCGYALEGRGITTDASVKRIGVPLFKDQTGRLGLDTRVTAAVIEELLKRGRFTVVKESSNVDAVVDGEIVAFTPTPVSFSPTGGGGATQASRYAITLTAKIVYRKIGQAEPIWSNDAFTLREEFDVTNSAGSYVDFEEQSEERLAGAFARSVVAAMLEAF